MKKIYTDLTLRGLELKVHLGWTKDEYVKKQSIVFDILIRFAKPPKACKTDHLQDTLCYDTLAVAIKKYLHGKRFHLIEHLAHKLYQLIKQQINSQDKITVRVKKNPNKYISNLTNGVVFSYGDDLWSF